MRSLGTAMSHARSMVTAYALGLSLALAAGMASTGAIAAELTFDLHIERGRLPENMRSIRVKQGDIVKLRCTADRRTTLHLHGYDIELRIEPGATKELSFAARATGRFPLHVHGPAERSGNHAHEEPPLATIEVYPR
jgi:FtsP/CotA-like multicopper oxidase with cupredoxin domain